VALRFTDRWVWDSWIADTGSDYHLFFLQAPRALGDQMQRHFSASIGHAVSTDLQSWAALPDALVAGPPGAWDDAATWTGSVFEHDGTWHLFYTGVRRADGGAEQRVGVATSRDLVTWSKDPANPLFEHDERWYEFVAYDAWRDPWVLRDPGGDGFHALITARANHGPEDARGVIGHAWSADLATWEVRPPLSEPGEFGHLEVPQAVIVDGTPVLVFSVSPDRFSRSRRSRVPGEEAGTFVAVGESLLGPWDIAGARLIPVPDLYAARLVQDRAGDWQVIGFRDGSARGAFAGEIVDPIPLRSLGLP
jgi:beta-fructofuranosidase